MSDCPGCAALRAELAEHRRLQTLGRVPPSYTHGWTRGTLPGGSKPSYAHLCLPGEPRRSPE